MKITIELNDEFYQEHENEMNEDQLAKECRGELEDRIAELDERKLVKTMLKKKRA